MVSLFLPSSSSSAFAFIQPLALCGTGYKAIATIGYKPHHINHLHKGRFKTYLVSTGVVIPIHPNPNPPSPLALNGYRYRASTQINTRVEHKYRLGLRA